MPGSAIRGTRRSSSSEDSLTAYLRAIAAYRLLDRDEEMTLGRRIRAGDARAIDQLVCANLRFVVSVAKRYQHQGVPLPDLIDEGNIGLIRAARKFDERKGFRFLSYAVWWIRRAILKALAENGHAVRLPVSRAATFNRFGRRANALRHELGREPTRHEMAEGLDVSEDELASMTPIGRAHLSLDAANPNDDGRLLDYLPDPDGVAPDREVLADGLVDTVERAFAVLRPREAQVLRLHFGFDDNDPMTLERIGALLGITRERVRQIKDKGLSRLRRSVHGSTLAAFTER